MSSALAHPVALPPISTAPLKPTPLLLPSVDIRDEILARFADAGGVLKRATLRRDYPAEQLQALIDAGFITKVRPGILLADTPTTNQATALALGGQVTCLSRIKERGFWVPQNASTHIRLPKHRYLNTELHAFAPKATLHHLRGHDSASKPETLSTVLRCAESCCDRNELVAIMESMLRGDTYSPDTIASAAATGGRKLRQAHSLVEYGADSGVETLVRLQLRTLGIKVRTQVELLDWRVDFLVGDWLVIEVDGYSFHRDRNEFVRDRRKDRALMDAGYHVRRFSYDDVMFNWDDSEAELLALIQANKHQRPSNAKRKPRKKHPPERHPTQKSAESPATKPPETQISPLREVGAPICALTPQNGEI